MPHLSWRQRLESLGNRKVASHRYWAFDPQQRVELVPITKTIALNPAPDIWQGGVGKKQVVRP